MYMKVRYGTTPPSPTCLSPPKYAAYLRRLNCAASRERPDTDLPTFTVPPRNAGTLPRSNPLPRTPKTAHSPRLSQFTPCIRAHRLPLLSRIHNSSLTPVDPHEHQRVAATPPQQQLARLQPK
jgi:hypothetical protein